MAKQEEAGLIEYLNIFIVNNNYTLILICGLRIA